MLLGHHDVVRLQISMANLIPVQIFSRLEKLRHDRFHERFTKRLFHAEHATICSHFLNKLSQIGVSSVFQN